MASAIDSQDLCAALATALSEHFGTERTVAALERRPYSYRTSYELEQLRVVLDDGTSLDLIFKNLGEDGLHEGARAAKPEFLRNPSREIEVYAQLLAPAQLGTPTYYGASADAERGRYWLFIEKVEGTELWQIGELEAWEATARWLARLHARFADAVRASEVPPDLVRYDADFYRRWPERARRFARERGLSADELRKLEQIADVHERLVERLVALPATFIHGEFYASNVLVARASGAAVDRVCPIDWEMAAVGPALFDLAALVTGWSDESRTAVALAYREAAPPALGQADDERAFLGTLDLCRLHLAIRWLGWAPDWTPPNEHRRDWLGEAERLAEEIDA